MTDKEYEALERKIEERNRIKAMVADLEQSKKEAADNRREELKRDDTSINKAWGGGGKEPSRAKIAGDLFQKTQIRQD